jgi:hypothetical protein
VLATSEAMLYRLAIAGMLFVTMGMVATQTVHDETVQAVAYNQAAGHVLRGCELRESGCFAAPPAPERPPTPSAIVTGTTIVNVTGGLAVYDTVGMVRLAIGEHVHAVDGDLVDDRSALMRLQTSVYRMTPAHPFVDITIDSPETERRVLVFANYAP